MANPNLEVIVSVRFKLSWLDALKLRLAGADVRAEVLARLRESIANQRPVAIP